MRSHPHKQIGTFSSQISRLAFELAQTVRIDAPSKTVSIDSFYYFGGWQPFVRCLVQDFAGFSKGHVIRHDGAIVPKVGFILDKAENRTLVPWHLTRDCSPGYPPMFETRLYHPEEVSTEVEGKAMEAREAEQQPKALEQQELKVEEGAEDLEMEEVGGEEFAVAMRELEEGEEEEPYL